MNFVSRHPDDFQEGSVYVLDLPDSQEYRAEFVEMKMARLAHEDGLMLVFKNTEDDKPLIISAALPMLSAEVS